MVNDSLPSFKVRLKNALSDKNLKGALSKAQERFRTQRESACSEIPRWEELRQKAHDVREHTLGNLDNYLKRFSANIEKKGGKVFFAANGVEANEYICGLALDKKVRSIVKGKSMVTEEIHLNPALEDKGIEVFETDLGEYIIQLAGDRPSHILGPAMHMNRHQIKDLFEKTGGENLSIESSVLTAFARKQLRGKFLAADMGITGCNFAIAQTGSLVMLSNEGNIRLSSTLPETLVVVVGMEKLVPDWPSLDPLLTALPRSASGQRISSYVSAITGPRGPQDQDGPKELHVVILDNGRSKILGSKYRKILHCVRCSACLNVCPVYRQIGGHAYGAVYPGPIGSVLSPLLEGFDKWKELPFASSLCGACEQVCPVKVPFGDYLVNLRNDIANAGLRGKPEAVAFKLFSKVAANPTIYRILMAAARKAHGLIGRKGRMTFGLGPVGKWLKSRDLPPAPNGSFRKSWREAHANTPPTGGENGA